MNSAKKKSHTSLDKLIFKYIQIVLNNHLFQELVNYTANVLQVIYVGKLKFRYSNRQAIKNKLKKEGVVPQRIVAPFAHPVNPQQIHRLMNPVSNHIKEIETYQKQPSDDEAQYEVIDTVSYFQTCYINELHGRKSDQLSLNGVLSQKNIL